MQLIQDVQEDNHEGSFLFGTTFAGLVTALVWIIWEIGKRIL